ADGCEGGRALVAAAGFSARPGRSRWRPAWLVLRAGGPVSLCSARAGDDPGKPRGDPSPCRGGGSRELLIVAAGAETQIPHTPVSQRGQRQAPPAPRSRPPAPSPQPPNFYALTSAKIAENAAPKLSSIT